MSKKSNSVQLEDLGPVVYDVRPWDVDPNLPPVPLDDPDRQRKIDERKGSLLPDEIARTLPAYDFNDETRDPYYELVFRRDAKAQVKFIAPGWSWYVGGYNPDTEIFIGRVFSPFEEDGEIGLFDLNDLAEIASVQRDSSFKPRLFSSLKPKSGVKAALRASLPEIRVDIPPGK